jgi:glycosyltransferase involved in cell wall biosynthesis
MLPPIIRDISDYLAGATNRRLVAPLDPFSAAHDAGAMTNMVVSCLMTWPASPRTLNALLYYFRRGAIVITYLTTTEAIPASRCRAIDIYVAELSKRELPITVAGYTAPLSTAPPCIVTVHDPMFEWARSNLSVCDKPIAIVTAYNEADIIQETIMDLLKQGCQVVFSDNWSDDGTYEIMERLKGQQPDLLELERFPAEGPTPHFELLRQLRHKEEVALRFPGRWIMHADADELRRAPVPTISLRQAFSLASAYGSNLVSFTCIDFRPIDDTIPTCPLEGQLLFFEHGTRPGHFRQAKAWLQGSQRVDLASSGGHIAQFIGAQNFPYRFLLKHYPVRSRKQGLRKIVQQRQLRYSPYERDILGWHTQYKHVGENSDLTWLPETLFRYDNSFWDDHTFLVITDLVERLFARSQFQPTSVMGAHR